MTESSCSFGDVETATIIPASEFNYETAKHRLSTLSVSGMRSDLSHQERLNYLSSKLDFTIHTPVQALGGLVCFLIKNNLFRSSQGSYTIV